jgi:SAM-dependent methyltransferase
MDQLIVIDVSERMLTYARAQAKVHHVEGRVQFQLIDVLRPLAFPESAFDFVNERLGASYIRTWEWPHLLRNCFGMRGGNAAWPKSKIGEVFAQV